MKHLLKLSALILSVAALSATACNSNTSDSESSSASSGATCTEPSNPYDEGSGHYKGFEWAAEHGGTCSTSASFEEGCSEYDAQEEAYDQCVAKR